MPFVVLTRSILSHGGVDECSQSSGHQNGRRRQSQDAGDDEGRYGGPAGIARQPAAAEQRHSRVGGHAGQLHPAVVERSGLPKGTCAVELDLDAIPITESLPAPRVSPFPAVFQDLSLVVGVDVAAQAVIEGKAKKGVAYTSK